MNRSGGPGVAHLGIIGKIQLFQNQVSRLSTEVKELARQRSAASPFCSEAPLLPVFPQSRFYKNRELKRVVSCSFVALTIGVYVEVQVHNTYCLNDCSDGRIRLRYAARLKGALVRGEEDPVFKEKSRFAEKGKVYTSPGQASSTVRSRSQSELYRRHPFIDDEADVSSCAENAIDRH